MQTCQEILRAEEERASWLEKQLPMMIQEYLGLQTTAGAGAATASTARY
jgi:bacterioferritin (cytochrome b1)